MRNIGFVESLHNDLARLTSLFSLRREGNSDQGSADVYLELGQPVVLGRGNTSLGISNVHVSREHCSVTACEDGNFVLEVVRCTPKPRSQLPSLSLIPLFCITALQPQSRSNCS